MTVTSTLCGIHCYDCGLVATSIYPWPLLPSLLPSERETYRTYRHRERKTHRHIDIEKERNIDREREKKHIDIEI